MTAKEHYEHHLGNFYSWMTGDFGLKQREQQHFFHDRGITPHFNKVAFDLGAGHGLQSVSLAQLGFAVTAIDFNKQLLHELAVNKGGLDIKIREDELLNFLENTSEQAELIVCMGDTLTHLESPSAIERLISAASVNLITGGKFVLSFRDLTTELKGDQRFIPVRLDENRMLTCFLEYFPDHVMIHDILYEKHEGQWHQKLSAYPKLRLNATAVEYLLRKCNFAIETTETISRMVHITGTKT